MARSTRSHPTDSPSRERAVPVLALIVLLASLAAWLPRTAAAAPPADAGGWATAETSSFDIFVQGGDGAAAANFATAYGGELETAAGELRLVFGLGELGTRLTVYAYTDNAAFVAAAAAIGRPEIAGVSAYADPRAGDVALFQPAFVQLSAVEARNQLRHAVSHLLTGIATGQKIPWGFDEGIAQYVERPVNETLARTAGIVQAASQRGELANWFNLNSQYGSVERSLAAAESYAVIAYLIDAFKLGPFGQFLRELATADSWRTAMRAAYGRDAEAVEKQWRESLPKWTANNWRRNLVAGFDLAPARALLAQANYGAALAALEPSLALYDQLNGPPQLQDAKTMARQCEIGTQAETLMEQTQQSLETYAYDRAANLIAQAKLQFAALPLEQQPTEMIATYETLVDQGLTAMTQLDRAVQLSRSWRDYPEARNAARDAGAAYAHLGDADGVSQAQAVLDDLDKRQRRVVLLLGALGVLTVAWLALWLWARGPSELAWG